MPHSKEYLKAYRQTEKYKAYHRAYDTSEKYKKWRRKYRQKIGNADSKRYEKTPQGFLMRCYRNMKSRVSGVQKKRAHLYLGKEILPKDEFYRWALNNQQFLILFHFWTMWNYNQKLTPTVNRIDSKKGYTLDNMEWLTHSENSRLTSRLKKT